MAVEWDATWSQEQRPPVAVALEHIGKQLAQAVRALGGLAGDACARAAYEAHFGPLSWHRLRHVRRVVQLMHERITQPESGLLMSYVPDMLAYEALRLGALPTGVKLNQVEAFVAQLGVAPKVPLRMFIAPAFFTASRGATGTLLHELSHGVGNTMDYAYVWQRRYASLSPVQRTRNADSYRAYCGQFDVRV
ncbi:hypothetical protein SAMN04488038_105134 [Solimonas aquatica]|uniref:Lysine-specific metallo-endopeptidase domain-containing protein n=1 Tax=Solimonas aquatica TaxID=489703 RepID=A0A1H9EU42_9GAMM|nr:M35 family metallo-endopeptidase [Solimonas aquatica]SEQ28508.1 hypothetical protein SAMN04488038_105134 [Solimonas aquatica]